MINPEGILPAEVLLNNTAQGGPRCFRYMQEYDMQVILLLLFHAQASLRYSNFSNVDENDFKTIYRAKPVLSS